METKVNLEKFCLAPWVHTFVAPNGKRQMCCLTPEISKNIVSFNDHWNSSYMKSIRKRMLSGETIPECRPCNEPQPYRIHFNRNFPGRLEDAIKNTADDGEYHGLPESIDYRITHLCNFKCIMCGEHYSTSWETENVKRRRAANLPELKNPNHAAIQNFQKEAGVKELLDFAKNNQLTEIYWAGGEPLINPAHWEVMKYLVESGKSKNVRIRYNTNLSHIEFKGQKLVDLIPHFPEVKIGASLDAHGKLVEYLRHGLRWDKWVANLDEITRVANTETHDVVFEHRITLPGLIGLKDLLKFAFEKKLQLRTKMVNHPLGERRISPLHPLCLPKELLHPLLEKALQDIYEIGSDRFQWTVSTIEHLLKEKTTPEIFSEELYKKYFKKGLHYQTAQDKFRYGRPMYFTFFEQHQDLMRYFYNHFH